MDDLLRRGLDDDGFFAPEIKEHSLEKIRIHNYYVAMFTTAMRERWGQLAYVGLFSGAGRARLSGTTEYVETSAMGALRVRFPFRSTSSWTVTIGASRPSSSASGHSRPLPTSR